MGPMSIRVATYFPFNVTCYFNGHSCVAQELCHVQHNRGMEWRREGGTDCERLITGGGC